MLKVIIHKGEARTISGTSKSTGKQYSFRVQEGYAVTLNKQGEPAPFPEKFEFMLEDEQAPFPAGEYQLHPSSLYVSRNGKLECSPRLAPVQKRPAATA